MDIEDGQTGTGGTGGDDLDFDISLGGEDPGDAGSDGADAGAGGDGSDAGSGKPAGEGATGDIQSFLELLPEEDRNDPNLKNFKSVQDFAKSYSEQRKMIGSMVKIPGEDATPEELDKFFQKIGKPTDAAGYELSKELPEGLTLNEDMYNEFGQVALESNLTKGQVSKLYEWYNNKTAALYQEVAQQQQAALQQEIEQGVSDLKKEWGSEYKENIQVAVNTAKQFLSQETRNYLDKTRLGNNVNLIKDFYAISKLISGDSIKGNKEGQGEPETLSGLNQELRDILMAKDYTRNSELQAKARKLSERITELSTKGE